MDSAQAAELGKPPENRQIDIVKRELELDVIQRAVTNDGARVPCPCGLYEYYSGKCGHLYKKVHLKCGKTTSNKGNVVLCPAGRVRHVRVETAVVPFYCGPCRQSGVRWTGDTNTNEETDPAVDSQPIIKQEGHALYASPAAHEGAFGDPGHEYHIPSASGSNPDQSQSSIPPRIRNQKENMKMDPEGSKDNKMKTEEAED